MKKLLILLTLILLPLTAGANPEPEFIHPLAGKKKHTEEEIKLAQERKFHLIAIRSFSWPCDAIAEIQEAELYDYLYAAVIRCESGRRYSVRNMTTSVGAWGGGTKKLTYCRLFKHGQEWCEEF